MIFWYITFVFLSHLYLPIQINSAEIEVLDAYRYALAAENEVSNACNYDLATENLKTFESRAFAEIEQSKPERFVLKICKLQRKDAVLEYLGLHLEKPKEDDYFNTVCLTAVTKQETAVNSENVIQNAQISHVNGDFGTMQQFQSETSLLKSFKLQLDISLTNIINEICQEISAEGISFSIKQILLLFSKEKQKLIFEEIPLFYPKSKISKCLRESQKESIDETLANLELELDTFITISEERDILSSMLMTLFFEKFTRNFLEQLPKSLEEIEFEINSMTPAFLRATSTISHFCGVRAKLTGFYFGISSHIYTIAVTHLCNCQMLELEFHLFDAMVTLFDISEIENEDSPKLSTATHCSAATKFAELRYLKLNYVHRCSNFKRIQAIQKFPNLKTFAFVASLDTIWLVLEELKTVADSTSLLDIICYCKVSKGEFLFKLSRTTINEKFSESHFNMDNFFDIAIEKLKGVVLELKDNLDDSSEESNQILNAKQNELKSLLTIKSAMNAFSLLHTKYSQTENADTSEFNAVEMILKLRSKICDFLDPFSHFLYERISHFIEDEKKRINSDEFKDKKCEILDIFLLELMNGYYNNFLSVLTKE